MNATDIRMTDAIYLLRGSFPDIMEEYRRGELDHFLGNGREYVFAIFAAPDDDLREAKKDGE